MTEVSNITAGPSAAIIGAETVTVTDTRGRKIKLRRLTPLLRTRLFKVIGPVNTQNPGVVGYYQMVVSVVGIDDEEIPFPTKETQIEAMLDRLGEDGMDAVSAGWKDNKWVNLEDGNPDNVKN
jgi:hypothetical protein